MMFEEATRARVSAYRCTAELIEEPDNPHDPEAVRVAIAGATVGYLARPEAKRFRREAAALGLGRVYCAARVVGGWRTNQHDAGFLGVELDFTWPLKVN